MAVGAEPRSRTPGARRRPGTTIGVAEAATSATRTLPDVASTCAAPWHPIADQGETASCVGWAVADSVLRWHLVEAGRLAPDEPLSARHVWMSAKETDQRDDYPSTFLEEDGTSLKAGLDVVRKFGVALEAELPWDGRLADRLARRRSTRRPRRRRIMAYFNLGDDTVPTAPRTSPSGASWLHQSGPVLVLVAQDRHFDAATGELDDVRRRPGAAAATPPRCSATAPTTSCCAPAGARTGATAATRA